MSGDGGAGGAAGWEESTPRQVGPQPVATKRGASLQTSACQPMWQLAAQAQQQLDAHASAEGATAVAATNNRQRLHCAFVREWALQTKSDIAWLRAMLDKCGGERRRASPGEQPDAAPRSQRIRPGNVSVPAKAVTVGEFEEMEWHFLELRARLLQLKTMYQTPAKLEPVGSREQRPLAGSAQPQRAPTLAPALHASQPPGWAAPAQKTAAKACQLSGGVVPTWRPKLASDSQLQHTLSSLGSSRGSSGVMQAAAGSTYGTPRVSSPMSARRAPFLERSKTPPVSPSASSPRARAPERPASANERVFRWPSSVLCPSAPQTPAPGPPVLNKRPSRSRSPDPMRFAWSPAAPPPRIATWAVPVSPATPAVPATPDRKPVLSAASLTMPRCVRRVVSPVGTRPRLRVSSPIRSVPVPVQQRAASPVASGRILQRPASATSSSNPACWLWSGVAQCGSKLPQGGSLAVPRAERAAGARAVATPVERADNSLGERE
mmetsp:Transcript_11708/g.36558  ORF Transcript_11708/g.36558 Transcript_11708/m.36558 type:complete len:492 (-) Transcript_11708:43-1518(-)